MIRLLTLSSLYPNAVQQRHGIFVERRLRDLLDTGAVMSHVIAPVPWFPSRHRRWGRYADFARVPPRERRHGIAISHPRYPVIPKIGASIAPRLMARWLSPAIEQLMAKGFEFDVIDAHYFYPDGVAAIELGGRFQKPVVITARGSDINVLPNYRGPRRQILAAAKKAAALISVSNALKNEMTALGMDGNRIEVVRNGVDTRVFEPAERESTRRALGHDGPILLSVGHLVEAKGHHLAIRALSMLPGAKLVIVGEGAMQGELKRLAASNGVEARVLFLGNMSQEMLCRYYSAADVLVLATLREGMPNVVLEALACGTPVVATGVGGIPEIVTDPLAGRLMATRTPEALAEAVQDVLAVAPDRAAVRAYAEAFGWAESTKRQLDLFRRISSRVVATAIGQKKNSGERLSSTRANQP